MPKLVPARIATKPQYVLHPGRAARRALHKFNGGEAGREVATLPWGLELEVERGDAIGYSILVGKVFDPAVTEAIHRLIEPGETVVDAGANIGYISSLAALRAGPGGRLLAFEPHPVVFELLQGNVRRWAGHAVAAVETRRCALSDHPGEGELSVGPDFHLNMGLASLQSDQAGGETVKVELTTLDAALDNAPDAGVMKVDVEGHEPALFAGARTLLEAQRIRDVIFEDHEPYPSRTSQLLEDAGYTVFALDNDLFGIELLHPSAHHDAPAWPGPSYLATCDPDRARAKMTPRWWRTPGIMPGPLQRAAKILGSR